MKRWMIIVLVVVLALSVMAVPAFAMGRGCEMRGEMGCQMQSGCQMAQGGNYVDADNDGVCDNMANMGGKGCCAMAG